MFPNDKWGTSGKNSEGCHSGAGDNLGRAQKGARGACQAVQETARRNGKVEGEPLTPTHNKSS